MPGDVSKEMCKAAYRAEQVPGEVVIYASGVHQRPGYRVSFERVGVTIFPPQFSFMHELPEKTTVRSQSPFTHQVSFETDRKVDSVVIYDADGRHVIKVSQSSGKGAEPESVHCGQTDER
ncbi:MAG: hypothetical protein JSU74_13400 [Candidatus Zixiibacteriota bacterium]|nr:MAG: hypothetical protein JSU74_13400 [candidate division Zixibacteria bacterium]